MAPKVGTPAEWAAMLQRFLAVLRSPPIETDRSVEHQPSPDRIERRAIIGRVWAEVCPDIHPVTIREGFRFDPAIRAKAEAKLTTMTYADRPVRLSDEAINLFRSRWTGYAEPQQAIRTAQQDVDPGWDHHGVEHDDRLAVVTSRPKRRWASGWVIRHASASLITAYPTWLA